MTGILITRPISESLSFAKNIKGYGRYLQPLLRIIPLDLPRPPKAPHALIFTSQHAANIWSSHSFTRSETVFCVGDVTASFCIQAGYKRVFSAKGNARDLLSMISEQPAQFYLFPSGMEVTADFEEMLGRDCCHRIVVYRADPTQELRLTIKRAFEQKNIQYVTLFSKKSAHTLAQILKNAPPFDALCLSQEIAKYTLSLFPHITPHIYESTEQMISFLEKRKS